MTEKKLKRRELIILEAEHLVGTDGMESIARRLGYLHVENLQLMLKRYGREDLARQFTPAALNPRDVNIIPPAPRPNRVRKKSR